MRVRGHDQEGKFPMDQIVAAEKPPTLRRGYAQQLADEMKTLVPGMERLAEIATELRADDLYRLLGYGTWDEFCTGYLGVSKRTANRWIAGPKPEIKAATAKTETAGESAVAGHSVPRSVATALKSASTPSAVPIEAKHVVAFTESEGVLDRGTERVSPFCSTPSDSPARPSEVARVEPERIEPNTSAEPPTTRVLVLRLLDVLCDLPPADLWNETSDEEKGMVSDYINELREVKATAAPPKRSPGRVIRPEDRAKVKLASVPVDPSTCDHPKDKRKKLAYGNLCERCGRMVA